MLFLLRTSKSLGKNFCVTPYDKNTRFSHGPPLNSTWSIAEKQELRLADDLCILAIQVSLFLIDNDVTYIETSTCCPMLNK
jgi:hypothetical protein